MTTLAEVRESIEVLRRIEDSWPYPYEVFEQHVERLRTWLDAQPAAPEPDWTLFDGDDDPPDCFIMSPWGNTLHYFHTDDIDEWWGNMPDMEAVHANSRMIVDVDQSTTLGIDWRTTLRRRPEAQP